MQRSERQMANELFGQEQSQGQEQSRGLFGAIKDAVLSIMPGLKDAPQEIGDELKRLGVQGQMEMASALFNGNAFVPYGPGQYAKTSLGHGQEAERGGMDSQEQRGQQQDGHGVHGPEQGREPPHLERGGRSM